MISIKPTLLVLVYLAPEHRNLISDRFELLYAPNKRLGVDRSNGQEQINLRGEEIEFVLTNGANGLLPIEIDAMPKLKLICSLGVGFENVAIEYARRCGIPVCNAAGTNHVAVADHAMAILLAAIRRVTFLNNGVRHGLWRDDIPRPPHVSGRKMGIFGLGAVGTEIAKRARGFDMEIGYNSRSRKDQLGFRWFENINSLAQWCDYLIIAAPASEETYHVVNGEVLNFLGPDGVLVNVDR